MMARILLLSLGGTITMTSAGSGGIKPALTGEQLVAAVPQLADLATIEVVTPFTLPGPSLTLNHLWTVIALLRDRFAGKAFDGAVIVQGTDTIEDTAFVLDLLLDRSEPIVVTGAMRGPQAPGADGPANLLSAVAVAGSAQAADNGVLVVLNDEIHAARFVRKTHTGLPDTFASAEHGRLGIVSEGRPHLWLTPVRPRLPALQQWRPRETPAFVPVAQIAQGLGEDGRSLDVLTSLGYGGAVIEGMGAGHVPAASIDALTRLASRIPTVLATRVASGRVFTRTYGYPGAEIDLIERGLVPAGYLPPHKARLLLSLLLSAGVDAAGIALAFEALQPGG